MDETLLRFLAFLTAIFPPIVILVYFLTAAKISIDTDKIWESFGFGACASFPVIVVARIYETAIGYGDGFYENSLNHAFFGAAVPEEAFKLIALLSIIGRFLYTMKPNQIFVLSISVACGFACLENIFYVVDNNNWHTVAMLRSISAVPGHAFNGALMGFFVVKAIKGQRRMVYWALAFILPTLLHGLYDFPLFAMSNLGKMADGLPIDASWMLMLFFICIVILEGVLAHLCLIPILKKTRHDKHPNPNRSNMSWVWRKILYVSHHPVFWAVLCLACLAISGVLFLVLIQSEDLVSHSSYFIFASLHAAAFAGLAIVQRRRNKNTSKI